MWRVAAVLLTAALVGLANPASAAFTSRTANPGDTFAAGTIGVTLTDGNNTAMYSAVANVKPGDAPLTRCITVTNTGNIPLQLKLYSGTTTGTGLGTYLNLSILRGSFGTPPAYPNCTTFTAAGVVYAGTMASFPSTQATEISDGGGALAAGATRVFQFDISLQDNSAAQGKTVTLPFTFEGSS